MKDKNTNMMITSPDGSNWYGKSYKEIWEIKKDFYEQNGSLLQEMNRIRDIYITQPLRHNCKLCGNLRGGKTFYSHDVEYWICDVCGHLNGAYQDTEDFSRSIYEESDYGAFYRSIDEEAYKKRIKSIYEPKARFMLESFTAQGIDCRDFRFLDIGAGSGYYVTAMQQFGLSAKGIEISEAQVTYGQNFTRTGTLSRVDAADICKTIRSADVEVLSFIGVLEHMMNLDEILEAIMENNTIRYLFFSVPMFSYGVIFESITPNIFNRQLGGGHTHLFTEESVDYLCSTMKLNRLAEWRFGTDIADLARIVMVSLEKQGNKELAGIFHQKFAEILDDLQLVVDKRHFCSEIHMLCGKQ